MAAFIIPTRIIPGCLLAGLFAGVGLFVGASVCISIRASAPARPQMFLAVPLLLVSAWYIRRVWLRVSTPDPLARLTALSPRLLVLMLTLALLVGLGTGITLGFQA